MSTLLNDHQRLCEEWRGGEEQAGEPRQAEYSWVGPSPNRKAGAGSEMLRWWTAGLGQEERAPIAAPIWGDGGCQGIDFGRSGEGVSLELSVELGCLWGGQVQWQLDPLSWS